MQHTEYPHWLDVSLVVIILIGAAFGARHGVLKAVVRLIRYVVAMYAAVYLHEPVVAFLRDRLQDLSAVASLTVGYSTTFLGAYLTTVGVPFVFKTVGGW